MEFGEQTSNVSNELILVENGVEGDNDEGRGAGAGAVGSEREAEAGVTAGEQSEQSRGEQDKAEASAPLNLLEVCAVCRLGLQTREPKLLPCLHSFCQACLPRPQRQQLCLGAAAAAAAAVNGADVTGSGPTQELIHCPVCRQVCQPKDIVDNYFVKDGSESQAGTDNSIQDQFDNLERHTQWKIDFLERFNKFTKERIEVEENYAKHMRQLVKRYQIKKGSKEDDECQFSMCEAFQMLLSELGDYAGQREVLAEGQKENGLQPLTLCVADSRQQRRKLLQEGRKLQNQLDNSAKQLEMAKRRYERDHRESEKMQMHAEKVEQESAGNKQDVDKVKQQSQQKQQLEEESKRDYATQLESFNEAQRNHYLHTFPSTLQKLQKTDEQSTLLLQQCMMCPATQEKAVMPIIDKCIDGILGAAKTISPAKDVDLVVKMYKSGFEPPGHVIFEDLSRQTLNGASSENSIYRRQKIWPWRKTKATSPAEDFSHLPPEQRRRKLQERIDELQKNISKVVDEQKGLMKMKDVYIKNSKLGNPASLEPQLVEAAARISRLEDELKKYQVWMSSAENKIQHRYSDGSILHSSHLIQPGGPSHIVQRSSSVDEFDDFDDDDGNEIFWCHVLYDFKAQGTDTVSVNKGDELRVVEKDRGDGWTRVQPRVGGEGYVPTTYIKTL